MKAKAVLNRQMSVFAGLRASSQREARLLRSCLNYSLGLQSLSKRMTIVPTILNS